MIRILIFTSLLLITLPVQAQKKKKASKKTDKIENKIPSLKQNFLRFSLFAHEGNAYIHRETNDVWMETFLEIRADINTVLLPGLGDRQSCSYIIEECSFVENDTGLNLIVIPIECAKEGELADQRIMRIHLVKNNRKTDYIFSLSYLGSKDLVLFHNYSDLELGKYLTNKAIRFE